MLSIIHTPFMHGAIAGLIGAGAADFHNFLTWKNTSDFKTFQWRTALIHWAQGFISGGLVAIGYGYLAG